MNFNKIGRKFLLGLVSLVVVLSCVKLGASAEGTTGILYLSDERIAGRNKVDGNYEVPTKDGYVFGGWYSDDKGQYPLDEEQANKATTAYAKWVPDYVLSVKAQVNQNALNDDFTGNNRAAIRLLTSVDSLDYTSVGFDVVRGDYKDYTYHLNSKNVFSRVRVVGETAGTYTEETPEGVFGSDSHFFEAVTFKNMPESAVNTELTVTPYWVTLDGTRVEGTYSIKTVNLGRSWVYIDSTANETDGKEYGTCGHPFTKLDSALDAVTWVDGKIIVKGTTEFEVSNSFKWNPDKVKVEGKVRTITVTGENGTSSFISFNTVPNMGINDNVTFENVKVDFASQVYANGNKFIVAKNVDTTNANTNLHGGAEKTEVENTHLEIYAGSWKTIYGGGGYYDEKNSKQVSQGPVKGNTNIILGDAKIFHDTKGSQNMVFGGGDGSPVGGNTNIIVGGKFNEGVDVTEHTALSTVYGGGRRSGGDVAGDTNITIQDDAKINYVYGGGAGSTEVNGTCNVVMNGGTVLSIWGGGAVQSNGGINEDTSVLMNGGTVAQIFGGNGSGVTGNTHVEVLGGTITRRIYGGCYHDSSTTDAYVVGTTTVVIGNDVNFAWNWVEGDNAICAGSRYAGEQDEEVGILIFNDNIYSSLSSKVNSSFDTHAYDYLVKSTTGGIVSSSGNRLHVVPAKENDVYKNATVRLDSATGSLHAYMTSEGFCKLPEVRSETNNREIYVTFADEASTDETVSNCEAKVNGTYYDTLENAVVEAKELSTEGKGAVVTLLKDVSLESALAIDGTSDVTVQNESTNEFTITGSNGIAESNNIFNVSSSAKLTLTNLNLKSGHHAVYTTGTASVEMNGVSTTDLNGCGIYNHGTGTITATNITIKNAAKYGVFVDNTDGTLKLTNVTIDGITGSDRDGIRIDKGKIDADTVTIKNIAFGCGIYNRVGGSASAPNKYKNVTIENVKKFGVYVYSGTVVNLENTSINTVNGDSSVREGIRCEGTLKIINGATIQTVKNSHGMRVTGSVTADKLKINDAEGNGLYVSGGTVYITESLTIENTTAQGLQFINGATATIKGINVSNTNTTASTNVIGASVYVTNSEENTEQNIVELIGGTISANHHGIYVDGTSKVEATNVNVNRVSENANTLVVVKSGVEFTLSEKNGTSAINGKPSEVGTYAGRGVEVEGTFNLNGGTISNHTISSGNGAGVLVKAGGAFNMNGGSVSNNTAPNGGGVSVEGTPATETTEAVLATFNLSGGSISSNTATTNGGGVAVLASGDFTMTGGTIGGEGANNTATNGGGVFVENTTFNLDAGTISYNTATDGGGVYLSANASLVMDGGDIEANTVGTNNTGSRGGGVCLNASTASFTLNNGNIDGNTARAGGGVIVLKGDFIMKDGSIKGNIASDNGGAVYLSPGYNFAMNGGTISVNEAKKGAAIYAQGASATLSTIALNNGEISDNNTTNISAKDIDSGTSTTAGNENKKCNLIISNGFSIVNDEIYLARFNVTDNR